jgi:hypothetical protein
LKIFKGGTAKKYNIIIFDQLILIYRANIGKRAILCQNIGIIGHIQKDRDLIGNIGPLEGLIICNNYLKTSKKKITTKCHSNTIFHLSNTIKITKIEKQNNCKVTFDLTLESLFKGQILKNS